MDLQQAQVLLNKINALQRSIGLDESAVSSIERDLMLSYIRQLYEAYSSLDIAAPGPKPPARPEAPLAMPRQPEIKPEPQPEIPPAPKPAPPPKPEPKPEPTPPPAPKPEPEERATPAPTPPKPTPPPAASSEPMDPRISALFRAPAQRELSDKLSQSSVGDLAKALSINDKLLYANELFGRDMSNMNATLEQLNRLSNMDEAKPILVKLAEKHDWTEEERSEVAESFIKLVRRRYA
ncbi:MAG: hypothetical protein KDC54_09020 [Lewinella sp.]|nr:hypothetical protein [Lewinella sp.]